MSRGARLLGAATLATAFLALEAMVVSYNGLNPASVTGVAIGALIGLMSLVLEIHVVERALRSAGGDTAGATFQTFAMRLAVVAPLTFVFQRSGSGVNAGAFAVSYLVTFFVYLCWLTWKTYNAPVQYKGRKRAPTALRIVARGRTVETTGSVR